MVQPTIEEISSGNRWFVVAGIVAVVFFLGLWRIDDLLSFSNSEARLGATLRELRSAQATLPGNFSDERTHSEYSAKK